MGWGSDDGATLMNQALEPLIKMKATLATRTLLEMVLHSGNFLDTEFPVNIKMQTSSRLKTIHKTSS
jgi:hypothetical protein